MAAKLYSNLTNNQHVRAGCGGSQRKPAVAEVNGSRWWRKSIEAGRAVNETASEIYVDDGSEGTAAIAANWEDGERQRRELEGTCKLINNQPGLRSIESGCAVYGAVAEVEVDGNSNGNSDGTAATASNR